MFAIIKKYYLTDKNIVLMTSEYDQHGKKCARVMIGNKSILIDRTPIQLMDDTLKYIGFDLKGATNGAKSILGKKRMCPVMINPYQGICLFPVKSADHEEYIWFNPDHIVKTDSIERSKTKVMLSNGNSIIVEAKLYSLNSKMQTAAQLKRISHERGSNPSPIGFYIDPKKEHQIIREKSGNYNISIIDEEEEQ